MKYRELLGRVKPRHGLGTVFGLYYYVYENFTYNIFSMYECKILTMEEEYSTIPSRSSQL